MKFFWNLINLFLNIRFSILIRIFNYTNFQKIINDINRKWSVDFIDKFNYYDDWYITEKDNYGSVRPDNISVLTSSNVKFNDGLLITSLKEHISGKDWEGNKVYRDYSSGLAKLKKYFLSSQESRFSALCNIQNCEMGSWPAFWIFSDQAADEDDILSEDKSYFEIDGFERFASSIHNLNKLSFSIHYGTNSNRKLYTRSIYLPKQTNYEFLNCIVINKSTIKIYINNILVFITSLGYPVKTHKLNVIFSDSISTFNNKVSTTEIDKTLPHYFYVKQFIKWNKK